MKKPHLQSGFKAIAWVVLWAFSWAQVALAAPSLVYAGHERHKLSPRSGITQTVQKKIENLYLRYKTKSQFIPGYRSYYRVVNLAGIELHVMDTWHMSEEALDILYNQIVPLVSQEPSEWLFIVEMQTPEERRLLEKRGINSLLAQAEAGFAKEIADLLGIPFSSPVVGIYNRRVVEEAERRGVNPALIAQRAFLEMHSARKKAGRALVGKIADYAIEDAAQRWNKDEGWLRQMYRQAMEIVAKDPRGAKNFQPQIAYLLADIANEMMRNELLKGLDVNQDKRKALVLAGVLHAQAIINQVASHPISSLKGTGREGPMAEKGRAQPTPKKGGRVRDRWGKERTIVEVDVKNQKVRLEGDSPYTWTSLRMVELIPDDEAQHPAIGIGHIGSESLLQVVHQAVQEAIAQQGGTFTPAQLHAAVVAAVPSEQEELHRALEEVQPLTTEPSVPMEELLAAVGRVTNTCGLDPAQRQIVHLALFGPGQGAGLEAGGRPEWTEPERQLRRAMVRSLINLQKDLGPATHVFVYREAGGWHIDTGGATQDPTTAQRQRIAEVLKTTLRSFQSLSIRHPVPTPKRVLIIGPTYIRIVERPFSEVRPFFEAPRPLSQLHEGLQQFTIWEAHNISIQPHRWVEQAIEVYFDIQPVETNDSMLGEAVHDVKEYLQGYVRAYEAHKMWMNAIIGARRQVEQAPSNMEVVRIEREQLVRLEGLAAQYRAAYDRARNADLSYQRGLYVIRQVTPESAQRLAESLTTIARREGDFQITLRGLGVTLDSVAKLDLLHQAVQDAIAVLDRLFPPPAEKTGAIGKDSGQVEQSI